tara:strand:+ start:614 stop:2311 length:1698 start_codon:yes stop_codon:yes gene_type:complete
MIKKNLKKLKDKFKKYRIDGYVIPKNDEYFAEYSKKNRLQIISNFSGSAGYAIILKNKNYLFVDGRYTIQAQLESSKEFKIVDYKKILNCNLFKDLTIGLDPKLFTRSQVKKYFLKYNKIKEIKNNLIDQIHSNKNFNSKPFYSLNENITGQNFKSKIDKIKNFLIKNKANHIFISAPENIAWLLNIRGYDNPNSPIPNCYLFFDEKKNFFLITQKNKAINLIKEKKLDHHHVIEPKDFKNFVDKLKGGKIIIDSKTCSLHYENILREKFEIIKKEDPIYLLKSIKNKIEINNMKKSHIHDGVALTKFLYWIKHTKKKITELDAQIKLEKFRKLNRNYLYPSFNTIAGSGGNGAIIHYNATKSNYKIIKKSDIFLCDSGGQYKYGTTDVTRTICFTKPKSYVKKIFTLVLKGHIAVVNTNLKKNYTGKFIDKRARKFLKKNNLDYNHGTGHGVGFFLNVHEGPQAISKFNDIKILEGMVLSNEPGFYKKNQFGIRIENLIYVKKINGNLFFKNLTLAPIDKDLIEFKMLNKDEKDYLLKYNLQIYSKLSPFLKRNEKKWLASFII